MVPKGVTDFPGNDMAFDDQNQQVPKVDSIDVGAGMKGADRFFNKVTSFGQ